MQSSTTFFKSFDLASGAITERFQNPFWRITERLLNVKLRRALSEVQEFGASIVATTLKKREYHLLHGQPSVPKRDVNPEVPTPQSDGYLINALIDNFDDPRLIADSALNFLSAGKSPIAQPCHILSWTLNNPLRARYNRPSPDMDILPPNPAPYHHLHDTYRTLPPQFPQFYKNSQPNVPNSHSNLPPLHPRRLLRIPPPLPTHPLRNKTMFHRHYPARPNLTPERVSRRLVSVGDGSVA